MDTAETKLLHAGEKGTICSNHYQDVMTRIAQADRQTLGSDFGSSQERCPACQADLEPLRWI
jgi:hypothetical protein